MWNTYEKYKKKWKIYGKYMEKIWKRYGNMYGNICGEDMEMLVRLKAANNE